MLVGLSLVVPLSAEAQTFTIPAGTTDSVPRTLSGTQTGTVEAGGTLRSTNNAATIQWNGASTGVVVTNSGTIENTGTGRVIDASGALTPRTFTFLNNVGAIVRSTENDAFRFNLAMTGGTIVIDNSGLIQAGGTGYAALGQALDLRGLSAAAGATMTVINRATGIIEAFTDDAVRLGRNATINNFGIIRAFGANTSGGANGTSDGIDAGGNIGIVVNNQAGGLISGARHGITADTDITVNKRGGRNDPRTQRLRRRFGRHGNGHQLRPDHRHLCRCRQHLQFGRRGASQRRRRRRRCRTTRATIKNYGIIEGNGAGGFDSGDRGNNSEGISIGGGTIDNFGTISGAVRHRRQQGHQTSTAAAWRRP